MVITFNVFNKKLFLIAFFFMLIISACSGGNSNESSPELVLSAESGIDLGSIIVTWDPVAGSSGYNVYESDDLGNTYYRIASNIDPSQSAITISGLDVYTSYFFKVAALGSDGSETIFNTCNTSTNTKLFSAASQMLPGTIVSGGNSTITFTLTPSAFFQVADIVFVIQESGGITPDEFEKGLDFIRSFVPLVGPTGYKIGVVCFSTTARFAILPTTSKETLLDGLNEITKNPANSSPASGIKMGMDSLETYGVFNHPHVLVFLGDGNCNTLLNGNPCTYDQGKTEIASLISTAESKGIIRIVGTIGWSPTPNLICNIIASSVSTVKQVYAVADTSLLTSGIKNFDMPLFPQFGSAADLTVTFNINEVFSAGNIVFPSGSTATLDGNIISWTIPMD